MPPACCRCNASGRCKNCACVKDGQPCTNCLPSRKGTRSNRSTPTVNQPGTRRDVMTPRPSPSNGMSDMEFSDTDRRSDDQPSADPTASPPPIAKILTPPAAENWTPDERLTPPNDSEDPQIPNSHQTTLPRFTPVPTPNFQWGDQDGESFTRGVDQCYTEIVHWRRNLFKVPSGKAGRTFVHELSHLFQAYAESSALEGVAMKSAMIMPALLLQKPHSRSKTKEHVKHLERRLQLWKDGNLNSLLDEGSAIQSQFDRVCRGKIKPTDQISRTFSKLMMEGKVRSGLRLISEGNNGQPLRLDNLVENGNTNNPPETVLEALLKKHPPKQPAKESTIVTPNYQHPTHRTTPCHL